MAFLLFSPWCLAGAAPVPPLTKPPLGERWFSVSTGAERSGFNRLVIQEAGAGYEVTAESSTRMVIFGFTRENASWERYRVNRDLSLQSFDVAEVVEGKTKRLTGEVTAKGVRVRITEGGSTREKVLKVKGALFPPPVLNVYPLMQGAAPGKKFRLNMLDIEAPKITEVKITVVGAETLAGGTAAVHLQNDLYPVANDIWVDRAGNTLRESVRDGLVLTRAEDGRTARKFLCEAALAGKEWLLDFSLVPADPPLGNPRELREVTVELTGIPATLSLLDEGGQTGRRLDGEKVAFTVIRPLPKPGEKASPLPPAVAARYLAPAEQISALDPEITARKNEIIGGEREPLPVAEKLTRWVAAQVAERPVDSRPPLETLAVKEGNSESHARLYASLARAAGIPTRVVAGLVYHAGKGFVYHCWAESFVGDWVAVDPTFGQVPADVTHLKLVEGDSPAELLPLADLIGRVRARILEAK